MPRAIRRYLIVATLFAAGLMPAEATGPLLTCSPPTPAALPAHPLVSCHRGNAVLDGYGSGGGGWLRCGGAPIEECIPAM